MLTQFAQWYPAGRIRYIQSTFLELVTDTEVHRIDFRGKLTCRLQRGTYGPVSFPPQHPLLEALHVPLTMLLARATFRDVADAPTLRRAIRHELQQHPAKWYDFYRHTWTWCEQQLADYNVLPNLTRTGGIILQSVPLPVAQAIARICARYEVETYSIPQHPSTSPFQLLLIGRDYIIAEEFFISTLCGMPWHARR
ncbi:hypothetical protein F1C16_20390 (plasmid) [Hymenobacter sp. NBH84]|uniref:hypothetical protein n=1 Tax=Hymenobacter sp. NBH84 TaxID=2596915 RepID=UPI0016244040|nr:hypothetical protein [Hymenobacter sp. NBH84]QNE41987.1 hypothetical protein F1C16_20390 [Hymenobacter sp. NBH84]